MTFQPRFSITNNMTTAIVIVIRRKAHPVYREVTGEVTREVTRGVTRGVTGEVRKLLLMCRGDMSRWQLQEALSLKSEENFRQLYLMPALLSGFIEMTIPDKPNSRIQKYRLTPKCIAFLQKTDNGDGGVTGEVTGEVRKLLLVCHSEMSRWQLQKALSLKSEENFRQLYLMPALLSGFIEMTIPDKPNSRMQKYRLTPKGIALL